MPFLTHCHECDKPTANAFGICDNCVETTTADKYNSQWVDGTLIISKKGREMINLDDVVDVEFSGIDNSDYPDFSDAFIESATYKGREMTEEELCDLQDNYGEWVYSQLMDWMH